MKKILAIAFITLFCLACFCSCGSGKETYGEKFNAGIGLNVKNHKLHFVEITVKNYGIITLTLDETIAPITVRNFVKLANEGFYDGLTFHRIMEGFMIQGGDPKGDGSGGSPEKIKGEFAANGIQNAIPHVRGVISMARLSYPYDSASSQFFIVHKDSYFLDGNYAAFGWVTSGMEFVDAICADTPVVDNNGTVVAKKQPVILSVRVVGYEDGEKNDRVAGGETYGNAFEANIGIDTTGHKLHNVEIAIEKYGIITLTLDETVAPITVQNFIKLANEGLYDGLTLHRIMEDFMIQGGAGASTETIKGEFSDNGVENPILHVRGVISMARTNVKDSATSQFFIVHKDSPHLNGKYAAFGWVTSGMEFVDAICAETPVIDTNGTVRAEHQPKILSVRVVTE
jgi:cyclophilin family peptidyl-prolyl cis-trans isomerase